MTEDDIPKKLHLENLLRNPYLQDRIIFFSDLHNAWWVASPDNIAYYHNCKGKGAF